jgi:hypothetical protein
LLGVFKGNSVTWVHLNSGQWGKLIYPDSLLDPEGLVFRGNGTGDNPESRISFGSCRYGLPRKGGVVAVIVDNPSRNDRAIQLLVDPDNPFVRVGGVNLNEGVVQEPLIRAWISHIGGSVIVHPWVLLYMDNRKVPISIAIFSNEGFA